MTHKRLQQLIKIGIYVTFFVPLLVLPSSFIFPFIVPKILLLRSLVILIAAGYALLWLARPDEYRVQITPLSVAVMAFYLSFVVSTFVGVDAYHSFWDNHERMLGLFTITHYIIYYFILSSVLKNWKEWKEALSVFLFAGSMVMVIGLIQVVSPNVLLNNGSSRVSSTLGNAIYLGGYGLFLFFVAGLLYIKDRASKWNWLYILAGVLALGGLFFSGTRGSMLGLLAALGVAGVLYFLVSKDQPKVRLVLGLTGASLVVVFGILFAYRSTEFVRSIPTIGRLVNASLSTDTGSTRVIAWKVAIEGWKDYPVFGWGPNNFFYAFNQHYNPRSLEYGYGETWFDNAHNILVNTLTVQGVIGLVTYLAIFAVAMFVLFKAYRKGQVDRHAAIIGAAFLVGHLVQNITVFENPTSYLYFVFWLALINRLCTAPETVVVDQRKVNNDLQRRVKPSSIYTAATIALVVIFIFNIQPARANQQALQALSVLSRNANGGNLQLGLEEVRKSLQFSSPHIDDIRNDITRVMAGIIGSQNSAISDQIRQELYVIAEEELKKNIRLHPQDIRVHLNKAQLHQQQALRLSTQQKFQEAALQIALAEQFYGEALRFSPRRQQIIYSLAIVKLQLGKNDEAIELLEGSIQDNSVIVEGYWRLAYAHYASGNLEKAKQVLNEAEARGLVFDTQGQQIKNMIMAATSTPVGTK